MSLTDDQVQLLRSSWAEVEKKADGDLGNPGVDMFVRLFSERPDLIEIFPFAKGDIENIKTSPRVRKHGKNVMTMVGTAVGSLDDLPGLVQVLEDLGKRHKKYKAKPEHFEPVGEALLYTLKESLGDDGFTSDVKDVWVTVFGVIKDVMSKQLV